MRFGKAFFSPAFAVFSLLFFLYYFATIGQKAFWVDDFTHWARVVQGMTAHNDFATNPNIHHSFASYPPGYSLLQYFVQRIHILLYPAKGFDKGLLFFAYNVFALGLVLPFLQGLSWKRPLAILTGFVIISHVPLILYGWFYKTLHVDPILGIVAGAAWTIWIAREQEKQDGYTLCYTLMMTAQLSLLKDSGILFALCLTVVVLFDFYKEGAKETKAYVKMALILLVTFLPKILWEIELAREGIEKVFSTSLDFAGLLQGITGTDGGYFRDVLRIFLDGLFFRGIHMWNDNLAPGILSILIVEMALLYILLQVHRHQKQVSKYNTRMYFWILLIQSLLFFAGMFIAYVSKFSREEGFSLASFERYMATPLLANALVLAYLAFSAILQVEEKRKNSALLALSVLLLLLAPHNELFQVFSRSNTKLSQSYRQEYSEFADSLRPYLKQGNVLVLSKKEGIDIHSNLILNFELYPEKVSWRKLGREDFAEEKLPVLLEGQEYIALFDGDAELRESLEKVLKPMELEKNIYKILK